MRFAAGAALLIAVALAGAAAPRRAAADEARARLHGGVGVGGFSALTGPARYGPAAEVDLYPGGRFGRFGVRATYLGLEAGSPAVAMLGVTFTAAASRPKLHLALHADAGLAAPDRRAVAGGGIFTQLWLVGPLAVGADAMALLFVGDGDPSLLLGTALEVRLSW